MHAFEHVRYPLRWLRIAIALLLIGFAANSIAHVTHRHDADATPAAHLACGYCVSFGSMADAPVHSAWSFEPAPVAHVCAQDLSAEPRHSLNSAARPRAPPLS